MISLKKSVFMKEFAFCKNWFNSLYRNLIVWQRKEIILLRDIYF